MCTLYTTYSVYRRYVGKCVYALCLQTVHSVYKLCSGEWTSCHTFSSFFSHTGLTPKKDTPHTPPAQKKQPTPDARGYVATTNSCTTAGPMSRAPPPPSKAPGHRSGPKAHFCPAIERGGGVGEKGAARGTPHSRAPPPPRRPPDTTLCPPPTCGTSKAVPLCCPFGAAKPEVPCLTTAFRVQTAYLSCWMIFLYRSAASRLTKIPSHEMRNCNPL